MSGEVDAASGRNDAEPWRFPPRTARPRKDLGPAASPQDVRGSASEAARRAADEFGRRVTDIASIAAEEVVHPFGLARSVPPFRGVSVVVVDFRDLQTRNCLLRIRGVSRRMKWGGWWLARTWADAGGDGALDEAMCLAAARVLDQNHKDRLRAEVVTMIGRNL